MGSWPYVYGHGTENDFVVVLDRDATLDLTASDVQRICDRQTGVGADGLLRAVPASHVREWAGDGSVWFMDYRNADGSVAEMCGNGVRVFARFLLDHQLASGAVVPVATRDGLKEAEVLPDGRFRVAMGPVSVGRSGITVITQDGTSYQATAADVGNPHAVSLVPDLAAVPLVAAPRWEPREAFPDGVNLEFVQRLDRHHLAMRVFERGVGETRSCGTGTVAVAAVAHTNSAGEGFPATYLVEVPGGQVEVELTESQAYLTGPAVLVRRGTFTVRGEG